MLVYGYRYNDTARDSDTAEDTDTDTFAYPKRVCGRSEEETKKKRKQNIKRNKNHNSHCLRTSLN